MNGDRPLDPTGGTMAPSGTLESSTHADPRTGTPYPLPPPKGQRKSFLSVLPWIDWTILLFIFGLLCTVIYSWTHLSDRVDTISDQIKSIDDGIHKESDTVQSLTTNLQVQQHDIEEMKSDVKDLKNVQDKKKKN